MCIRDRDQGTVAETFQYSGTKIITPDKVYDPADEADAEYFEFGLFMSRREYKAINRRLQRGRMASLSEGKYIAGTAPYGLSLIHIFPAAVLDFAVLNFHGRPHNKLLNRLRPPLGEHKLLQRLLVKGGVSVSDGI